MESLILDGTSCAKEINEELKQRVAKLVEKTGRVPILATILVGEDPASITYVKMKGNACKRAGLESMKIVLPQTADTDDVTSTITELNFNGDVHGILLQHPVPKQIDEARCFNTISPDKDVDGVTYMSFAKLAMNEMEYGPATPLGIMRLLDKYKIVLEGKEAVIIGRSPILGKPMAMMLLNRNATVTMCHSRTQNLPEVVRRADIVVAALGKPKFVKADWIKPGAVVIDAGYNPGNVGDADLENMKDIVSAYTPVPGGVGPMTIITLIEQTVASAEKKLL
ncbi:MAG: bifunctional 5,10-methylene-tetrahydrofolate dehydrogenase/5,10-methylene-tetrahydrofolate cyclohydrolase [Spirochaetaceae bacterium]|nr:MAG: bifunctional 5,10-methylene-tetrahydrofolate dehydrogenase/5,10-methylene-tetrahydrofolate cyclohydrolase [Spirochaetaceae bacterium]